MKKSLAALCLSFGIIFSLALISYFLHLQSQKTSNSILVTNLSPSVPPISAATPAPLGNFYANKELAISFQYPVGYFVFETPKYNRIVIQNEDQPLTGVPKNTFRDLWINYGSFAYSNDQFSAEPGVTSSQILVNNSKFNLYSFPNPVLPTSTIVGAVWGGRQQFSLTMTWNHISSDPMNGIIQSDEAELLRKIVPTIITQK